MPAAHPEFLLDTNVLQFNHAGMAPWPRRTAQAVIKFANENASMGSFYYNDWVKHLESLRRQLATFIGAEHAEEIAFTKNTSESLSIVAGGIDWQAGENIVLYAGEFPSNRFVWEAYAKRYGVEVRYVPAAVFPQERSGVALEEALLAQMDEKTRLLALSSVQYATGYQADLTRIGEACKQHGVLFCIDAIQSLGAVPFSVDQCQADFVCADGHKWMLSPESSGLLYCRKEHLEKLRLHQFGWHMVEKAGHYEEQTWQPAKSGVRFECGSMNHLGFVALAASLSLILEVGIDNIHHKILTNVQYLFENLDRNLFTPITSMQKGKYAGILTMRPLQADNDKLYQSLIEKKLLCARRIGGIRLSPHFYTTKDMMNQAIALLHDLGTRIKA